MNKDIVPNQTTHPSPVDVPLLPWTHGVAWQEIPADPTIDVHINVFEICVNCSVFHHNYKLEHDHKDEIHSENNICVTSLSLMKSLPAPIFVVPKLL